MRLYISNDENKLIEIVCSYLSELLDKKKVEMIVNGNKKTGIVKKVELEKNEYSFLVVKVDKKEERIPIMNDTKARFGKELIVLETKNHSTIIEILD